MSSVDETQGKRADALVKLKQATSLLAAGKVELHAAQTKVDQAQQMINESAQALRDT